MQTTIVTILMLVLILGIAYIVRKAQDEGKEDK